MNDSPPKKILRQQFNILISCEFRRQSGFKTGAVQFFCVSSNQSKVEKWNELLVFVSATTTLNTTCFAGMSYRYASAQWNENTRKDVENRNISFIGGVTKPQPLQMHCVRFSSMMATHSLTSLHSWANASLALHDRSGNILMKIFIDLELRINFENFHQSHLMTKLREILFGIHFVNFILNCDKLIREKFVWPISV